MIKWQFRDPRDIEMAGFIPSFVRDSGEPLISQLNRMYAHGGGWQPMPGWSLRKKTLTIQYLYDPPHKPYLWAKIGDETIAVYPHAWVMVLKADGTHEVARMD